MAAKYIEDVCKRCQQPRYVRKSNGLCDTCHTIVQKAQGVSLACRFPSPH